MLTSLLADSASVPPLALLALFDPQRWVVIIMPLAGISLGAIAIIGGLWIADRNRRQRHETARLALEKGLPIPEFILNEDAHGRQRRPRNDRRTGLILIGIAIGLYLFFRSVGGPGGSWVAAIPGFIGVALLLNWLFERMEGPPPSA